MGEVITPEHWLESGASRNRGAEENRRRAADERAARQKALLDSKEGRLLKEDRKRIARNLGQLVEELAASNQRSPKEMIRDLFEKYNFNLLSKRRRLILLKGEVPPSGKEAFFATLPTYRSLAKVLAGMNPRAALDRVSIEQRYEQRLVSSTTLSIDSESNGGLVDVEAIGGLIDLLQDATKLLKAKVPRLIEHFEALAISRIAPTMKSMQFGGNEVPHLTPLHDLGPIVDSGREGDEHGVLTLTGCDEAWELSEDEFEIEHHWPSTKVGTILVTKATVVLHEGDPDLAAIAAAYRGHLDWGLQSNTEEIDLDGGHYGKPALWRDEKGRGHFIESEDYKDRFKALFTALDKKATEVAKPMLWRGRIERRFPLHLCVYPARTGGQTDYRFGCFISKAETATIWNAPCFQPFSTNGSEVAISCQRSNGFTAVRASDLAALDDFMGNEGAWDSTTVAPLNSPATIKWLGGRTLDWAMSDNPRTDRYKEGVVVVFEPTFAVPNAPGSAPLATPAGMIERSILHDASGDDVLSRIIQDAEARIEWFDGVQASWSEIHRQARAKFTEKINEALENLDPTNQTENQA